MDSFTECMVQEAEVQSAKLEAYLTKLSCEKIEFKQFQGANAQGKDLVEFFQAKQKEYRELLKQRQVMECDEENNALSEVTKERLKKLAHLFGNIDASLLPDECPSPLGSNRRRILEENTSSNSQATPTGSMDAGKKSTHCTRRLAQLASQINNWEDESEKKLQLAKAARGGAAPVSPRKAEKPSTVMARKIDAFNVAKEVKKSRAEECSGGKTPSAMPLTPTSAAKKVTWDNKIISSLEAQGFQRCESQQHLVYDYTSPKKSPGKCNRENSKTSHPSPSPSTSKPSAPPPPPQAPAQLNSPASASPLSKPAVARQLMTETLPVKKDWRVKTPASPKKSGAVLEMAARIDSSSPRGGKVVKDPTELSVHDRKAIFERNSGPAILPKAPFGMAIPVTPKTTTSVVKEPIRSGKKEQDKKPRTPLAESSPNHVAAKDNVTQAILERQREIDMLRSRWERKREEGIQGGPKALEQYERSLSPPRSPNRIVMGTRSPVLDIRNRSHEFDSGDSSRDSSPESKDKKDISREYPSLMDVKKLKVSPPKPGRIYPSISDIETESEAPDCDDEVEFDDSTGGELSSVAGQSTASEDSLGQMIVEASRLSAAKRSLPMSPTRPAASSTRISSPDLSMRSSSEESRILHEMDNFLDEALGESSSPPKRPRDDISSWAEPRSDKFDCPRKEPPKEDPTLMHTVSFYRKSQAEKSTEQRRLAELEQQVEIEIKNETPESVQVEDRIRGLEEEIIRQTTIISQTSMALNLCHSRSEFSGSAEQVEAEKLLLIANCRRSAAVKEVERLKVERTIQPGGSRLSSSNAAERGDLTVEYLSVPFRSQCATAPNTPVGSTEHLMCLVSSGADVQATPVMGVTKQNLGRGNRIVFTKHITLRDLYPNFTVAVELYRLVCSPHGSNSAEEKKCKLRLTPQKKTPKHRMPLESPGGPNAVRSSSFQMVGFVVFSLRETNRTKFTLNKVPYGVQLEGTLEIKMSTALKAEVEYRGFLTQYEEVTGFGAWKRRWAVLRGSTIAFWTYPEHEEDGRVPVDTIDLGRCLTKEVGLVSREICARPHTFLVEMEEKIRYLLSADTLDDRLGWCKAINKSLNLIRCWGGRT